MKRSLIVLIVVALAVLALIVGQFVLGRRLPEFLQNDFLPKAQQTLDVPISTGEVSFNILTRSLTINDIAIGNPETYGESALLSVGQSRLTLSLLACLTGKRSLAKVSLDDTVVAVTRNPDKSVNVGALRRASRRRKAPPTEAPATAPFASSDTGTPSESPTFIRKLALDTRLTYTDAAISDPPFHIEFAATMLAEQLSFGTAEGHDGKFEISGHLAGNPEAFKTQLHGIIAPIGNPLNPTFDIFGTVTGIDASVFESLYGDLGLSCEDATFEIAIRCVDGKYNRATSEFRLILTAPKASSRLAGRTMGVPLPDVLTIRVPLGGTLDAPKINIEAAVIHSVLDAFSKTPPQS